MSERLCIRRFLACFLLALAPSLFSCQHHPWRQNLFFAKSGIAIYFETKHDEEEKLVPLGYSHPLSISPESLRSLFQTLQVVHKGWVGGDDTKPLFTGKEVNGLVEPLFRALNEVKPDERVRFLSTRYVWNVVFPSYKGTSAVIFATAPDQLHFAFDWIDETLPDEESNPRDVRFYKDPTEMTSDSSRLIPPEGAQLQKNPQLEGGAYPRWLVVNPQHIAITAPPEPTAAPAAVRVVLEAYKGFNVVKYGDTYYGLPQSEGAFQIEKARRGEYKRLFSGKAIEEVLDEINRLPPPAAENKTAPDGKS